MGSGKRLRRGGGRSSSIVDRKILLRRIASCKLEASFDAKSVAVDLQDRYPDYRRHRRQPLTVLVEESLQFLRRSNAMSPQTSPGEDAGGLDVGPSRKKRNIADLSEQRLAHRESEHLRRVRRQKDPSLPQSTGKESVQFVRADPQQQQTQQTDPCSSSSSDDYSSTSEDAVFSAKFDPEFDVMKLALRDSYVKQANPKKGVEEEEKNMEIEVAVEKPKRTMKIAKGGMGGDETPVRKQESSVGDVVGRSGPRFSDLGGMQGVLDELMMEVIVPLCHPQLPEWLGVRPMGGLLLHGPPGCGKTKLAHAIANETGVPFYKISAPEVVSGVSGASEKNIRDLFEKAYRTAPSIVFIDEIDAIASKRDNLQREMERRIVTQLMTCMDDPDQAFRSLDANSELEASDKKPGYVLVIGATNRPDAVDQGLRRPGRFDREIALGVPDENAREQILTVLTRNLRLEGKFNLFKIARSTPGFVGADLAALVNKAGNLAMKRIIDGRKLELFGECKDRKTDWWRHPWTPEEIENLHITMDDFEKAANMVQPSSRREGFSSIPKVKWEDVGGLKSLRKDFDRYIVQRIKSPEDYEEFGINLEAGFLLYGPPGCGKTLIAKAVANEAGANFIHIKGPELLNKYVGESESAVRTIFARARTCSPCIIFFDEVDALTTKRGKDGGWVVGGLLNQLLVELDGAERKDVFVIGATNRLEVMDPAVLRPGRFGKVLYVPLPNADERGLILKALARTKPIAAEVDLDAIGRREACNNLTGADLAAVMNEAAIAAMEEKQMSLDRISSVSGLNVIKTLHFEKALEKVTPSVSDKERSYYEASSRNLKSSLK